MKAPVVSIATRRRPDPAAAAAAAREALITEHLPLVRGCARRLVATLPPCFELDDLISEGVLGLMKAAGSYDPSLNVPFAAWALVKIRGQILHYVRDEARRHTEELFELTAEEKLQSDPFPDVEADLSRQALMGHVREALAALPVREQHVLDRYYVHQEDMSAIGEQLGVGKARVCQLHKRALAALRRELRRRGPDFAIAA